MDVAVASDAAGNVTVHLALSGFPPSPRGVLHQDTHALFACLAISDSYLLFILFFFAVLAIPDGCIFCSLWPVLLFSLDKSIFIIFGHFGHFCEAVSLLFFWAILEPLYFYSFRPSWPFSEG